MLFSMILPIFVQLFMLGAAASLGERGVPFPQAEKEVDYFANRTHKFTWNTKTPFAPQTRAGGRILVSKSGALALFMQGNGDLCTRAYDRSFVVWCASWSDPRSEPNGTNDKTFFHVEFQRDENLVVYKTRLPAIDRRPIFETGPLHKDEDKESKKRVVLQDNGNLAMYTRGNDLVWAATQLNDRFTAQDLLSVTSVVCSPIYDLANIETNVHRENAQSTRQVITNGSGQLQSNTISVNIAYTVSQMFSSTSSYGGSVTISAEAEIPFITSISGSVSAHLDEATTMGETQTDSEVWVYEQPVQVGPYTRVTAEGILVQATEHIPWTCERAEVTMSNGKKVRAGGFRGTLVVSGAYEAAVEFMEEYLPGHPNYGSEPAPLTVPNSDPSSTGSPGKIVPA